MKIGTDGVLLGAWASLEHDPQTILDVGTGTGVIALMLAQRSGAELLDAVEIDENAYEQSVENFENSDWGDRLFCYHAEFEEFVEEMQDEEKYDLIISNPPFYSDNYSSEDARRDRARFTEALPFEELLKGVSLLLSETGRFNVIIPKIEEESFLKLANDVHLFPYRVTRVKGNPESSIKRSLLELGFSEAEVVFDELTIETARHEYTSEYIDLVKDFYLKM
ncbi:tRNA1(Val) (adenine(37)-N6)-methyltransferase [Salinimicrobium marinum]|uniref:tRNA1(Val) (adenine(37)-N6)-methyltransferase n=2 Tax=Salinimicrobium marinum TaxID=680283 RepID=A0A918W0W4_9FLAO|nr:tRNA1(Val) (adenine(37)-N6)-methyltransferase [Salinimicrobium marinum]